MWGALPSYFISINSHVSRHPYQLDSVMSCQLHQGLMAFPDSFGIHLEALKGLDGCLTVRKNIDLLTFVALFCILCYESLNGVYFSLEYHGVESKTEAVSPSGATSLHPAPVSVLFLDPTVYQTRPPLLSGLFHSAIHTCQETGPWIHCIIIHG